MECLKMCEQFCGVGEENECLEVAGSENGEAGFGQIIKGQQAVNKA